ncbi:MAG: radical SAM protein [Clostridia bacterium]|nr:radical SAM protein [Clostridia bacterium]
MSVCNLCPRRCGADRSSTRGVCRMGEKITLARAALHGGEEPCLAPNGKSGAMFFSGCSLGCVFCQNAAISSASPIGWEVEEDAFCEILLRLVDDGAENVDLVTASHFIPQLERALKKVKGKLNVPVIFNCSGYETPEALRMLDGLVDVYLPDFKFADSALALRLCRAPDYPEVCAAALSEMYRQTGKCTFDESGKLLRGLLVRHLVLPNFTENSLRVLECLNGLFSEKDAVRLSLMRQFTPMPGCNVQELSRPLTGLEYDRVTRRAASLGFLGYTQQKSSVGRDAIPLFDGTGV